MKMYFEFLEKAGEKKFRGWRLQRVAGS